MKHIETAKQVISAPILEKPPSGQQPTRKRAPRDAAPLAEAVVAYHGEYADVYKWREQRAYAEFYVHGQLSDLERKTVEPMVLALQGPDPAAVRAVHQLLGEGAWDDAALLERRERLVAHAIGQAEGVLICAGSGFPTQGQYSGGVARQDCGAVGQIANGQHGVCVADASSRGETFVERRLSMPDAWCSDAYAEQRARCGVPREVALQTEPAWALEMVKGVAERGPLPCQWVAADEHYGRNPTLLDGVAGLGQCSFAEVPKDDRCLAGGGEEHPARPRPSGSATHRTACGLRHTESARSAAARRATDRGRWATVPEQGRGHRADHGCVRLCAGNAQARTPSGPPGVAHLPTGSGARGGDPVRREERIGQVSTHDPGTDAWAALAGRDRAGSRQDSTGHGSLCNPRLAWLASSKDDDVFGASFPVAAAPKVKNKAPALTLAQARVLIDHALGRQRLPVRQALGIITYGQERNDAAYCSHRKRTLQSNRLRAKKPQ